ncbi:TonB-dependent receptor [Sphingobium sp. AP50]|uniref:TonB-dependent receptor n=1 Tax=Sphingobium sp. AP50 TaxID=1884369 RepID=UPI000AEE2C32|nr:TonB-dependent receptor [Sphingobium sp. AP50]
MSKINNRWILFATVAAGVLGSTCAGAQTGAQGRDESAGVPDIVVTATRRSTNIQRTAEAISVLSGEIQRERGQQRLDDLQRSIPNVNFNSTSNTSQIYVRGVGNTFILAGGDPGVATYQDGAYVSDISTSNTSMYDVERVEVLRGPQGGLYGRNAVGGAINIISAKPTDTFEGRFDAVLGNYDRRESEGYLSGPLGFANTDFRISYQLRHSDGYTKNLIADQAGAPGDLDDLTSHAVRVQTLTNFTGGGSLRLLFSYADEHDNGAALGVKPTIYSDLYPAFLLYGERPSSDPRSTYANIGENDISVYVANATLNVPIGENKLEVTGNYRRSAQRYTNDCDGTRATSCTFSRVTRSDDYFADVHLASSDAGRLRWLLGATYIYVDQDQSVDVNSDTTIPGLFLASLTGGRLKTEAVAAYGDVRFALTDVWALTGQLRYGKTVKDSLGIHDCASLWCQCDKFPASFEDQ